MFLKDLQTIVLFVFVQYLNPLCPNVFMLHPFLHLTSQGFNQPMKKARQVLFA